MSRRDLERSVHGRQELVELVEDSLHQLANDVQAAPRGGKWKIGRPNVASMISTSHATGLPGACVRPGPDW